MRAVDGRSEAVVIWRSEQGGTVPKIAEGELERLKATPQGAAERIEVLWQPYPPTAKPELSISTPEPVRDRSGCRESDFWLAACEPGRSRNYDRARNLTNFPANLLEI